MFDTHLADLVKEIKFLIPVHVFFRSFKRLVQSKINIKIIKKMKSAN